jgi:hypothetical protein
VVEAEMMTKEEFVPKWIDEVSGLLMASFAEADRSIVARKTGEDKDMAEAGRQMLAQLRRARSLLERIHHDLAKSEPKPVANNQPQNTPRK